MVSKRHAGVRVRAAWALVAGMVVLCPAVATAQRVRQAAVDAPEQDSVFSSFRPYRLGGTASMARAEHASTMGPTVVGALAGAMMGVGLDHLVRR